MRLALSTEILSWAYRHTMATQLMVALLARVAGMLIRAQEMLPLLSIPLVEVVPVRGLGPCLERRLVQTVVLVGLQEPALALELQRVTSTSSQGAALGFIQARWLLQTERLRRQI